MRVHVLQHVPFEDIGSIASWLAERGATIEYTRFYESFSLPRSNRLDLLIVMGGSMSVNDESSFPWLRSEKRFIQEVIRRGVPIVGVCLGGQLIAASLGARVYASPEEEIGWYDIEGAAGDDESVFRFPDRTTVFHWHGETFDLPEGAIPLARSTACDNQAFQIGTNAIGLQFHLETIPDSLDALIRNCRHELVEGPFIQAEAVIRSKPERTYKRINQLMDQVLTHITHL